MATKLMRIDPESEMRLREIMNTRLKNGLIPKVSVRELSPAEAIKLQFKTPSWHMVAKELATLPKKITNGN